VLPVGAVEAERKSDVASVLMVVGIVSSAAAALSYGFDASRAGEPSALGAIAGTYVLLAAGAVVYGLRTKLLGRWLVPGWGDITRGFAFALVVFVCAFGMVKLLSAHGSPRAAWMARIYLQLGDTKPLRQHQGLVGLGITVMAVLEETVWRGWVQSLLDGLVGRRFGWVAAAALYALAHVPTLWALADSTVGLNPIVVMGALGAGLVWGAMVRIFGGRLWPSIVCHALFDWAVLMMFRLWGPSV
jgi:membrane protease YdiL (CAAX protease family)